MRGQRPACRNASRFFCRRRRRRIERAAILAEGAGLSQDDATEAAARELTGGTQAAFVAATVARWRTEIERLPPAITADGEKLLTAARAFLASPWAAQAVAAGWGELELFGVHVRNARRLDAMGLVPFLAWSTHRCEVGAFGASGATLRTLASVLSTIVPIVRPRDRLGATQTFRRFPGGLHEAVPFWEHAALIGNREVAA